MEQLVNLAERVKRKFGRVPYDSAQHPAEAYYASIYLELIASHLAQGRPGPLRILDAGCGTGRLALPLAEAGHRITAIDYHRDALRVARSSADRAGTEIQFIEGDLGEELESFAQGAFDAILAIESLYVNRDMATLLTGMRRLLRQGGMLFVTHRTRYFYMLQSLAAGRFDDAARVASGSEGRLQKGRHRVYYNWQSLADLDRLYSQSALTVVDKHAIGPYSGFGSDPLAQLCDPGQLPPKQRAGLRKLELHPDPDHLMAARYVLVISLKEE